MIIYLIPEYIEDKGDCCRVGKNDGETIHLKTLQTIIRNIYKEKLLDIEAVKQKSIGLLNQRNLIPLFVSEKEILIPVKIRKMVIARDCMYGYVNKFEIQKVLENHIILNNRQRISFYEKSKVILKRIRMAELLEDAFKLKEKSSNISAKYAMFITAEDIEKILEELRCIKERIDKLAA